MPAAKDKKTVPADKLALYEKLVATVAGVERKGASVPYTSANGNMFSYLAADGTLALRLPKDARENFLTKYQTTLMEAYGIVQKEYVTVPAELLKNTEELKAYFEMSYEYIMSLKPKPTKKGGKSASK
jgi:hypothetical protein